MINTPVTEELEQISRDYNKLRLLKRLTAYWACVAGLYPLSLVYTRFTGASIPNLSLIMVVVALAGAILIVISGKRREATITDVAREIEKRDPRLNTLLLAAVEQQPDPATGKFHFLQERVIREASKSVRASAWGQKFTESLFFAQCIHLFAVALFLICIAFSNRSQSIQAGISPQLRKAGIKITPGDVEVEKGTGLAILAEFGSGLPQKVELQIQPRNGAMRTVTLAKSLDDPVFGTTLSEVTNDFSYQVFYDGKLSPLHKVSVFEYPELKQADATILFPEYTALPTKIIEDTRRVTALEGSKVDYLFQLNKPVKVARLVAEEETITLTNASGRSNVFQLSLNMEETKKFRLHLLDESGRTNRFPPDIVFQAIKNELPKLRFVSPRGDQKVSPLQEVAFHGEAEDDFGLLNYGFSFTLSGQPTKIISVDAKAKAREKKTIHHLLALEDLKAEADQLISFYLWAEDFGADGKPRRTSSDIFFAEVRPFDEIFREGSGGDESSQSQQQQGGGGQTPYQKLAELQKQIITATWNLQKSNPKLTDKYKSDLDVVLESQKSALLQAGELKEKVQEEKMRSVADTVLKEMGGASEELENAQTKLTALNTAVEAEQAAYQGLLKLQAREHQVSRSRQQQAGGGGGGASQQQLDQLELKSEENRYETESQAQAMQNPEQREELQALNRLKELSRRQEDMSERLKELQLALNEATTEEAKEEVRRQLKRLQEEQQQIVQDMDELQQRMSQPENQSRMAEAREKLDQTRQQANQTSQQLNQGEVSQALASSARTEKDLKKLSEDFRKNTSQQFVEDMRNMRQQARQLQENQQHITQEMEQSKEKRQRTLSDTGEMQQLQQKLEEQKKNYQQLMENMKRVTEQAEVSEPLLSRQLYETIRKSGQENLEQTLETSARFLERNFVDQAAQLGQKAGKSIDELKAGVDRAASSVLGDETEALRLAQRELDDLARRVERELASSRLGAASTNQNITNMVAIVGQNGEQSIQQPRPSAGDRNLGTNQIGGRVPGSPAENQANSSGQNQQKEGEGQINGEPSEIENSRASQNQQAQQARAGQRGEQSAMGEGGEGAEQQSADQQQSSGENGSGEQTAQNTQQGGGGGTGQRENQTGDQQQQGEANQDNASVAQNQNGGAGSGSNTSAEDQNQPRNGRRAGQRNFFDRPAGPEGGGDTGGGGGEYDGPITGGQYGQWTDRLRDVEEMIDDPELRNQVARIREEARTMRRQFGTDKKPPQWEMVQTKIVTPMRTLQNRLSEELARRQGSDALAPVDRDPVPARFSDLVNNYYEELGRGN
ncbi:MAG: hypothetical protein ACO1QB_11890 [Verrucomicrobiales bacterium]